MTTKRTVFFKSDSIWDALIHIGIMVSLGFVLVLGFFVYYLPWTTNHGETVTVPDLTGMSVAELANFMDDKDMDFVVQDSVYSKDVPPYTVLAQSPEAGEKVKQSRKIYIIINPKTPPKVAVPKLTDMPLESAKMKLRNLGLELGRLKYIPFIGENVVLEQKYNGIDKDLEVGTELPKGSKIDLVVGDGIGEKEFKVPDLVNLSLDEAEMVIKGHELTMGEIIYDYNSDKEIGTIIRQNPPVWAGADRDDADQSLRIRNIIRAGEIIDLWVSGNPTPKPRPEDEEDEYEIIIDEDGNEVRRKKRKEYDNINIRDLDEIREIIRRREGEEEEEESSEEEKDENE